MDSGNPYLIRVPEGYRGDTQFLRLLYTNKSFESLSASTVRNSGSMGAKIRLNGLQGKIEDINESTSELEKIQAVISKVSDNLRGIKGINDSLDDLSDRLATHSIKLDYSPVEYSHNLEELSEAEEKVTSEIKDLEEVFQNILFPQAQPTSKIVNCILD